MNRDDLEPLLAAVAEGRVTPQEALASLADFPIADLGFARLDVHRALRSGLPESVYGAGKTPAELAAIARKLLAVHGRLLVTRLREDAAAALRDLLPAGVHHPRCRVFTCGEPHPPRAERVAVVSAGTSDLAVAEEAAVCAEWFGHPVDRHPDVGVAGLHRLLAILPALRLAGVVVAVAGMDGALPTLVAGLVAAPVVAVPTSVGYGASFDGLAALLTMLNACAPGVAVVNIDNGYGAAVVATRILAAERRE
jgi:NCAIR mutase (PurE)-related protein